MNEKLRQMQALLLQAGTGKSVREVHQRKMGIRISACRYPDADPYFTASIEAGNQEVRDEGDQTYSRRIT